MICRQCSNIDSIKNTVFGKEKAPSNRCFFYVVGFYKPFIFDLLYRGFILGNVVVAVVFQTRVSVSDVELCFSRDGIFLVVDEKQHERNRKGYKFCGGSCEPKPRHVP